MRKSLGTFVLGTAGGWLLSSLRAMPGGDLFAWPMAHAGTASMLRAVALAVIALALWRVRAGVRWSLMLSIATGYALHGLLAGPRHGLPWIGLVVAAFAAWVGARWVRPKPAPVDTQDGAHSANPGEMLGLFVAGAGAAMALESIARLVRPFGAGLAQDDTLFGVAFLLLLSLGAAAFGWMASARAVRRLSFPVLLAMCTASCFASLALLEVISDSRGLGSFLSRWGLRMNDHGTLRWDLLIGAASFVAPALVLGAAFSGARGRRALTSTLLGAAAGIVAIPLVLDRGHGDQAVQAQFFSAQMVPLATMITVGGAAVAILSESRRKPAARYLALALVVLCALPALLRNTKAILVLTPWSSGLVLYGIAFETPNGLAVVRSGFKGASVAVIDGRALSPSGAEEEADTQRLRDSFALLPAERRTAGEISVLLVGQLNLSRAKVLEELGAVRIDRSASWWNAMARLEGELFKTEDGMESLPIPSGDVLAPSEARARLAEGEYDVVIAPPVHGDAPAIGDVEAPAKTVVVRWLALDEPLRGVPGPGTADSSTATSSTVFLSAAGLEGPTLGIATNAGPPAGPDDPRPRAIQASRWDENVPTPLAWSIALEMNRPDDARKAAFKSLAQGWQPPPPTPFIRGLEAHYAAQVPSSPYEHEPDRVEISESALHDLVIDAQQEQAGQKGVDAFTRRMWEWLANVLSGKRDVTLIEKILDPVARAHAPWPALEVALAYAELEGLEAPLAIERLERVATKDPTHLRAWFALGEAREIAQDPVGAAAAFKKASDLEPANEAIRRRLAMAACRAGDPLGKRLAQEIVIANPRDEEMQKYLEPGPPPAAPTAYQPRH